MITSGLRRPSSVWVDSLKSKWTAFEKAGALENAAQLKLPPLPAHVRRAECARPAWWFPSAGRAAPASASGAVPTSCAWELARPRSTSFSFVSTLFSDSRSGCTSASIAFWRPSRSSRRALLELAERGRARDEERSLFCLSASDDSAANASRSLSSASCSSASFSAPLRRSASSDAASARFLLAAPPRERARHGMSPTARPGLRRAAGQEPSDTGFPRWTKFRRKVANLKNCMIECASASFDLNA